MDSAKLIIGKFFLDYSQKHKDEFVRKDMDAIRDKLKGRLGDHRNWVLTNPLTGYTAQGLNLDRLLNMMTRDNTIGYGTDDIVDMLSDAYELCKPKYKNMDPDSDEAKTANETFERGIRKLKRFYLTNMRRQMGTFGDIPNHLNYNDSKALLMNHGKQYVHSFLYLQDMSQLLEHDTKGQYFSADNEEDNEYKALNSFSQVWARGMANALPNEILFKENGLPVEGLEDNTTTGFIETTVTDSTFLLDENFKKKYFTGPTMSSEQIKQYNENAKKTMSEQDYNDFIQRSDIAEGSLEGGLSLLPPKRVENWLKKLKYEGRVSDSELDVIDKIMLLEDFYKRFSSWNDPDSEPDSMLRMQILDAKKNLVNMRAVKELCHLRNKSFAYKNDKENYGPQSKEYLSSKAEAEAMLRSIKVADSFTPDEE